MTAFSTAETEKQFKQQEHQRERSRVRDALKTDKEVLPHPRQFGDPAHGPKDGKMMRKNYDRKAFQK